MNLQCFGYFFPSSFISNIDKRKVSLILKYIVKLRLSMFKLNPYVKPGKVCSQKYLHDEINISLKSSLNCLYCQIFT